ncbi:MAG: CRISPR-associated ring nuclease Csm6 [Leptothrix ochracea]|uniref:CRISPR-associated ring nuclease Csm6 n=1 Tax=Leptothrix ochracea TaxID=735331 RepID=UPI0034E1FCDA
MSDKITANASSGRRVLVCVSGMSPAIVTETLYALVTQQQDAPFVPDEIHVITTVDGKEKIVRELLAAESGMFHRFMRDHLPELPATAVRFDESTVHVISQTAKAGKAGKALSDITTDDDNRAAADTIYSVLRKLKSVPNTRLHASVAGGRKSMSFYMGHAFSLVAEAGDRLSHVLVNEPFENPALKFYFPPRQGQSYRWQERDGTERSAHSDQAVIRLAELSVLRLGGLLAEGLPPKALNNFDFTVQLAQAAIQAPPVRVVWEKEEGRLEILGEVIKLQPQQFLVFALYAMACKHQTELPNGAALIRNDVHKSDLLEQMLDQKTISAITFKSTRSKIQQAITQTLGRAVARHFQIEAVGIRQTNQERPTMLHLPPDTITLVGMDAWWPKLRAALRG